MRTVILDDEHHCTNALKILIEKYTDLKVVAIYNNVLSAVKGLESHEPDILFLDIEMPYMNGFEFLQQFKNLPCKVIFTTAYDEYAVRAFKVRAIDYLLKPVSKSELVKAVDHAKQMINDKTIDSKLISDMQSRLKRVTVTSLAGLELLETDSILYLMADSNYTRFALVNGTEIISSKTLKTFSSTLKPYGFIRVHNSYLVNAVHIVRYVKGDGGYLVLSSGEHVSVSRSRKEALMAFLSRLS